jgi:SAM-dependent methyltransferase
MSSAAPSITGLHLAAVRAFYDHAPTKLNPSARHYRALLAHYYNLLIPAEASVLEVGCGSGELLARLNARRKVGIDLSSGQITAARARLPEAEFHVQAGEELSLDERFDYIVISDTLNLAADVQSLLERLHTVAHADTRLLINYHSNLWRPLLSLARLLGLKTGEPQSNWLASSDLRNLLALSRWSPLTFQGRILMPVPCLGLERLVNRWIAPLVSTFCLTVFCVARPASAGDRRMLSVSVVIPARNEADSIGPTLGALDSMECHNILAKTARYSEVNQDGNALPI